MYCKHEPNFQKSQRKEMHISTFIHACFHSLLLCKYLESIHQDRQQVTHFCSVRFNYTTAEEGGAKRKGARHAWRCFIAAPNLMYLLFLFHAQIKEPELEPCVVFVCHHIICFSPVEWEAGRSCII